MVHYIPKNYKFVIPKMCCCKHMIILFTRKYDIDLFTYSTPVYCIFAEETLIK